MKISLLSNVVRKQVANIRSESRLNLGKRYIDDSGGRVHDCEVRQREETLHLSRSTLEHGQARRRIRGTRHPISQGHHVLWRTGCHPLSSERSRSTGRSHGRSVSRIEIAGLLGHTKGPEDQRPETYRTPQTREVIHVTGLQDQTLYTALSFESR